MLYLATKIAELISIVVKVSYEFFLSHARLQICRGFLQKCKSGIRKNCSLELNFNQKKTTILLMQRSAVVCFSLSFRQR